MHDRLAAVYPTLLAVGVLILCFYQWRWIDRVAESDLAREQIRLQRGAQAVASEIDTEITRAVLFFADAGDETSPERQSQDRPDLPAPGTAHPLQSRLVEWSSEAPVPHVVAGVLAAEADGAVRWHALNGSAWNYAGPLPNAPAFGPEPLLIGDQPAFSLFGGPERRRRAPPFGPPGSPREPDRSKEDLRRYLIINTAAIEQNLLNRLIERRLGSEGYFAVLSRPREAAGPTDSELRIATGAVRLDCLLGGRRGGRLRPDLRRDYLIHASSRCLDRALEGPALWHLTIKHQSGRLGAPILAARNRNRILFAAGMALLLGALTAFVLAGRRARRLAEHQIEFAMSVSHELKTPLTVIRLAGDNLASGIVSPEQVRRYGERVGREAERLTAMVEQVLTFARSGQPGWRIETAPVEPEMLVSHALSASGAILRDAGIDVVRESAPDLPLVQAEAGLAVTALTNLLVNAATHGGSGKYVRLRAGVEDDRVVFEVQDRGPGVPHSDLKRILQPFVRGSRAGNTRGTGLGLHLVRRIAEAHGGSVDIDSQPGAGTTVRLRLPAAATAAVETAKT